jgi:PGAP1-like protein
VPVLFIPGNAGSYRQVRPIAAEAASQFFNAYKQNNSILQDGIRNLDFFTGMILLALSLTDSRLQRRFLRVSWTDIT